MVQHSCPLPFYVFSDAFSLDPNTGLVRSRRLLQSSERFNLTVVATDQGRPPMWGTADLIITVIDVNDNRPVFVRPANGTIIHISEVSESHVSIHVTVGRKFLFVEKMDNVHISMDFLSRYLNCGYLPILSAIRKLLLSFTQIHHICRILDFIRWTQTVGLQWDDNRVACLLDV